MADFNRGTGLLVIEVRNSNPNGDPDRESEPRMMAADERGMISPVSVKRKLRDLVADKDGAPWKLAAEKLDLPADGTGYGILESRGRDRKAIENMDRDTFSAAFWDGRVFCNTFLESMKDKKVDAAAIAHFITTGTVQVGLGMSVAPVEVERLTMTNKSGVQEGKDRGMAPLGFRVVRHGVYTVPFFVNPMMARKSGCTVKDIALLKFLLPHAYSQTASAARPFVSVLHAWYAEHKSPLGSCPDPFIVDLLTPVKTEEPERPSTALGEYQIPKAEAAADIVNRLAGLTDLCVA
jgi:CRISPR-associated protein Csd2